MIRRRMRPAAPIAGALLLALGVALLVAACGKKGDLAPVEGSELYKNTYPAPETMTPNGEDEAAR